VSERASNPGARALLATVVAIAFGAMLYVAAPVAKRAAAGKMLSFPRFATLRSATVNLRVGPGRRYAIEWVYRRKGWPIEITAAYGPWRRVRDADGTAGWIHRNLLSNHRAVVVRGGIRRLRDGPEENAAIVARLEPGVVAGLEECRPAWCRVEAAGYEGWIPRGAVWGVRRDEGRAHG
jgi:SH3-like domain-containing protein